MQTSGTDRAGPAAEPRGVTLGIAKTDADFEGILALQRRNLRHALTQREQSAEGFVYLQHDVPLLRRMSARLPQAIAVAEGRVVGYCLALAVELRRELPDLEPMFLQFARCRYLGQPLSSYRFFVGGQVCVDRDFRGQGLAGRLYRQVRKALPAPHDVCVTEIAARNRVSISSHAAIGFQKILDYFDGEEDWVVAAWDLTGSDD
jgi:GNAT superfamily N-acetyltransferase